MTPDAFIRTWSRNPLSERASAQSHFRDLCALLGVGPPSPLTAGTFEFEKGAAKTTGGDGWADVWMKDAFGWEYKKTKANLDAAYAQVQRYAPALDNPPLLIVSDTQQIVIRTAFTGAVQERHDIAIDDLRDAASRDLLRRAFEEPLSFRPKRTRADLTEDAAATFADLALRLRQAGHEGQRVPDFTVHRHPILAVRCPTCAAAVGNWCRRPSGHRAGELHAERRAEADRAFTEQHGADAAIRRDPES